MARTKITSYFKDINNNVFAYSIEQLEQVSRLTELELLTKEREPAFIDASNKLELATLEFNEANELLSAAMQNSITDDESISIESRDDIQRLTLATDDKKSKLDEVTIAFEQVESEYLQLKNELDEILPVFFDIRESISQMKEMTKKEIDAHLNPPISKEQLIAEAEQQKQSLLAEANSAIAPLQDAVDLDMATDEEKAQLTAWKTYRVYLNRVDTSLAPDIDWPKKPT